MKDKLSGGVQALHFTSI